MIHWAPKRNVSGIVEVKEYSLSKCHTLKNELEVKDMHADTIRNFCLYITVKDFVYTLNTWCGAGDKVGRVKRQSTVPLYVVPRIH